MFSPLFLGLVQDSAPKRVPDALSVVPVGTCGAVVSEALAADDLLRISAALLELQRETPLIPIRPSAIPMDLSKVIAPLEPDLDANFDRIGKAVEFVVQIPVSVTTSQTVTDPKDYLRSVHDRKRAWTEAIDHALNQLGAAVSMLEGNAIETKRSEPNVKQIASIHYLMNVDLSSDVVSNWQGNRAAWSTSRAVLTGPWAPYSFVDLRT